MDLYCFMLQQDKFQHSKLTVKLYFCIYSKSTGGAPEIVRYHYPLSFRTCMNLYEAKLKLNCCIYSKSTGGAF